MYTFGLHRKQDITPTAARITKIMNGRRLRLRRSCFSVVLAIIAFLSVILVRQNISEKHIDQSGDFYIERRFNAATAAARRVKVSKTCWDFSLTCLIWSGFVDPMKTRIAVERAFHRAWMKHTPPYDAAKLGIIPGSRGVVLTGASKSVAKVIAAVLLLRETGCKLPVQFSYLREEVTQIELEVVRAFNISTVDISRYVKGNTWDREEMRLGAAKVDAIMASPFEEVLFLDPDNFVLKDPTYLFDTSRFNRYGALFWPDFKVRKNSTSTLAEVYQIFNLTNPARPSLEFETGQIVLNKRLVHDALHLTKAISFRARYYFKQFLGDKEAFYWGFAGAGVGFFLNDVYLVSVGRVIEDEGVFNVYDTSRPGRVFCGTSMLQMDFKDINNDGDDVSMEDYEPRPLFMHWNMLKYVYEKDINYFQTAMTYKIPLEDLKLGRTFADYPVDYRTQASEGVKYERCLQMSNVEGLRIRIWDWASENPGNWSEKFHKALSTGEEALFDAYIKDIRANASKGLAKLDNRRILEGLA